LERTVSDNQENLGLNYELLEQRNKKCVVHVNRLKRPTIKTTGTEDKAENRGKVTKTVTRSPTFRR